MLGPGLLLAIVVPLLIVKAVMPPVVRRHGGSSEDLNRLRAALPRRSDLLGRLR